MNAADRLPDGVYIDLPVETYLAQERLSSGGIINVLVDPLVYWTDSWMNPNRAEREETKYTELGSAYHTRILEGREAFDARYSAALDPADYPEALRTQADLKAACEERELKVSGTKADLTERLLAVDPDLPIWETMLARHAEAHADRTLLSPASMTRIAQAAHVIDLHPDLRRAFSGGIPEVTVLWTCRETKIPMRCRIDYLKPKALIELKSFSLKRKVPLRRAINNAIGSEQYQIQMALYDEALSYLPDLPVFGDAPDWLRVPTDRKLGWVFQETSTFLAKGRWLPRTLFFGGAKGDVERAKHIYATAMQTYGTDPWVNIEPFDEIADEEFPLWATQ